MVNITFTKTFHDCTFVLNNLFHKKLYHQLSKMLVQLFNSMIRAQQIINSKWLA